MIIYTSTPNSILVQRLIEVDACDDGIAWLSDPVRYYKTSGETIREYSETWSLPDNWVTYPLFTLYDELSPKMRMLFIKRSVPRIALRLYIQLPKLTAEEESFILSKIKYDHHSPEMLRLMSTGRMDRQ